MKYLGVLVFLFFVVSCDNVNDSSFLGNTFGKPDIKYDCGVYMSGKVECDFVNNGNKAGRLCITTVVSQNPKFTEGRRKSVTSNNCSGIINAKDKRTILFPNNFNGHIGRNGFARDGITDFSFCRYDGYYKSEWHDDGKHWGTLNGKRARYDSINLSVDRSGNKVRGAKRIRELQAIWHYGCDFEYTPYIIKGGKKIYS